MGQAPRPPIVGVARDDGVVLQRSELEPLNVGCAAEHEPAVNRFLGAIEQNLWTAISDEGRDLREGLLDQFDLVVCEDPSERAELSDAHQRSMVGSKGDRRS
jgi:hypothetical protein